jgi:hypothetical protein
MGLLTDGSGHPVARVSGCQMLDIGEAPISPGGGKFKQIPTYKGVQRDRGRCDQGLSLSGAGKADPCPPSRVGLRAGPVA